jgi:hypothetical protein
MNCMPTARRLNRWLLRPVMLLLTLAQLVVVVMPAFDRADDRDSGIHLESAGTRLHYVHDDTACPACQAQHLVGRVVPPARVGAAAVLAPRMANPTLAALPHSRERHPASPRAPPVV